MDLKYGLTFWFTFCAMLLLFGTPQMLMVEGLKCDICIRVGTYGSPSCTRAPCNNEGDKEAATELFKSAIVRVMEDMQPSQTEDLLQNRSPSGERSEIVDAMIARMGGAGSDNKFSCKKPVGKVAAQRRDGALIQFPIVAGLCTSFDLDSPPQAQPYTDLGSEPFQLAPGFDELKDKLYVCDESNEGSCQISEGELMTRLESSGSGLSSQVCPSETVPGPTGPLGPGPSSAAAATFGATLISHVLVTCSCLLAPLTQHRSF